MLWFIVIVGAFLGLFPASIASGKGHPFAEWWIFGALLFIVALPMALMLKPGPTIARPCPYCRALIPREATACQHCTREVVPMGPDSQTIDCPGCHAANVLAKGTTDFTCQACGEGWSMATKSRRAQHLPVS